MVGQKSGGIGSVGGASINGLASQPWVEDNYLSKEFFSQLFTVITTIHTVVTDSSDDVVSDTTTTGILLPNDVPGTTTTVDEETGNTTTVTVAIESVRVLGGLWTNSYLSALGQNSGGGGGGGSSTLADLLDVQLSTPLQDGQVLKYSSTLGKWVNGSGGGIGTVTSVATGTGLTGGPITGSGTISIDLTFQTYINHGETAYGWGNHADAGYATAQDVADTLSSYATQQWVTTALTDYATKTWVVTALADYATKTWVVTALTDYATKTWVENKGYLTSVAFADLTSHPTTLSGYGITDAVPSSTTWWGQSVSNGVVQGSIDAGANGGAITGFDAIELNSNGTLSGYGGFIDFHYNGSTSDFTSRIIESASGTLNLNYLLYVRNNTVYIGGDWEHMNQSYKLHVDGSPYFSDTAYIGGQIMQDANYFLMHCITSGVNSYGLMVEGLGQTGSEIRSVFGFHPAGRNISFSIDGYDTTVLSIRYNTSTHDKYAIIENHLNVGEYIKVGSSTGYIDIGGGRIEWDSTNNALKVINADGTAGNLYATGGVSALGMSAGASSIDSMTFGYLTVNTRLILPSTIVAGTAAMITQYVNDSDCIYLFNDLATSKINSETYYFTQYDNVGIHGTDYNYGETWWIDPDGCALFQRLYLSNNVYIFTDGSNIKCRIGTNIYTLTKS